MTVTGVDSDLMAMEVSARDGVGIDELITFVGRRTVALIGESGAGKSTLVNALLKDDVAAEGAVRAGDRKGRHTTTSRELHRLPSGGVLVDTPGIREVGIFADTEAVAETFPDLEEIAGDCRFRDCAHLSEPGCAVRDAIALGVIDEGRVARWRALEDEAAESERRTTTSADRSPRRPPRRANRPGGDAFDEGHDIH